MQQAQKLNVNAFMKTNGKTVSGEKKRNRIADKTKGKVKEKNNPTIDSRLFTTESIKEANGLDILKENIQPKMRPINQAVTNSIYNKDWLGRVADM